MKGLLAPVILTLVACGSRDERLHEDKAADDTGSSPDSGDVGDSGDAGDAGDPGDSGDSRDSGQDDTASDCIDTGDPPWDADTGWYADLPVYDCPGPPEDAYVVNLTSAYASARFVSCVPAAYNPFWFGMYAVSWEVDDCRDADGYQPYLDAEAGAMIIELTITAPYEDPIAYQGEWDYWEGVAGGGVFSNAHAFELNSFVRSSFPDAGDPDEDGYVLGGTDHWGEWKSENATLCLSRVRPNRMRGTVFVDSSHDPTGVLDKLFITFDVSGWPGDGDTTCYGLGYSGYEYDDPPLTEADVWYAARCSVEGCDTGT